MNLYYTKAILLLQRLLIYLVSKLVKVLNYFFQVSFYSGSKRQGILIIVIPAQAGIQTSVFQKYLKITVNPNFWIPACAGMTAAKCFLDSCYRHSIGVFCKQKHHSV